MRWAWVALVACSARHEAPRDAARVPADAARLADAAHVVIDGAPIDAAIDPRCDPVLARIQACANDQAFLAAAFRDDHGKLHDQRVDGFGDHMLHISHSCPQALAELGGGAGWLAMDPGSSCSDVGTFVRDHGLARESGREICPVVLARLQSCLTRGAPFDAQVRGEIEHENLRDADPAEQCRAWRSSKYIAMEGDLPFAPIEHLLYATTDCNAFAAIMNADFNQFPPEDSGD